MKRIEPKNPKKKNFLRIPTYPGGKDAYLKFISENIVYPEPALANKVEGLVYVAYSVNNMGEVTDVEVTKGIGSGCDEEAIRVIRMLQYEPARNRGVKLKAGMKTRILFKLPQKANVVNPDALQLNYTPTTPGKANSPEAKPQAVYNYTIKLG